MSDFKQVLMEELANKVQEMIDSEQWYEMLDVMSRFHKYSFRNVMLIMLSKPGATRVTGYRKWEEMNRRPKRGSAIWITGYRKVQRDEVDEATGEKTGKKITWTSFPPVKVFDVSDTYLIDPEGPDPVNALNDMVQDLEGSADEKKIDALTSFMGSLGWEIEYAETPGGVSGYAKVDGSKKIVISDKDDTLQQFSTLVHESAHAILHADEDGNPDEEAMSEAYEGDLHRGLREVEAESTAYTVLKTMGIDASRYSVGYIAQLSGGDPEVVISTGTRVGYAQKKILEGMENALSD